VKEYSFAVNYIIATSLSVGDIQLWCPFETVENQKHVEFFRRAIRRQNNLQPDDKLIILSFFRLPGDDREIDGNKIAQFKRKTVVSAAVVFVWLQISIKE